MAKFDEIKEQSSTGIQYAIEQHKYTDISVDLMSSYVIVPEGGVMREWVQNKNKQKSVEGIFELWEKVSGAESSLALADLGNLFLCVQVLCKWHGFISY